MLPSGCLSLVNSETKAVRLIAFSSLVCLALLSNVHGEEPFDLGQELARMTRLPTQDQRTQALSGLLRQWVAVDVDSARVTVEAWPDALARPWLLGELAWYWSERDIRSALSWAKGLRESERESAVLWSIKRFPYAKAREARAEVLQLPLGRMRDCIANEVIAVNSRGREAGDWCATYPDYTVALTLVRKVTQSWIISAWCSDDDLNVEAELIEGWAFDLTDVRLRDRALAGTVDGLCRALSFPKPRRQPETFRRLLRCVDDAVLRAELSSQVDQAWQKAFPDNVGNPAIVVR